MAIAQQRYSLLAILQLAKMTQRAAQVQSRPGVTLRRDASCCCFCCSDKRETANEGFAALGSWKQVSARSIDRRDNIRCAPSQDGQRHCVNVIVLDTDFVQGVLNSLVMPEKTPTNSLVGKCSKQARMRRYSAQSQ